MLGFLPCGLVYAALLKAMESAGALAGALTMLAFGSGTAVALLAGRGGVLRGAAAGPLEQPPGGGLGDGRRRGAGVARADGGRAALPWLRTGTACGSAIHLVCFLIFLALPFLNVIRFDIPRQRFYFAGLELWINEFAIIFFTLMFLMFLVVVSSRVLRPGVLRIPVPADDFQRGVGGARDAAARSVTKQFTAGSRPNANGCARAVLCGGRARPRWCWRSSSSPISWSRAICCAAWSRSTSAPPAESRARPSRWSPSSISAFVRQRFCTTVCPYGYLQGMLGDGNTLLVHYRDEDHDCIECKKCVRVCPMGIDIRAIAVPDRVRPLRRVHRCLRRDPGEAQEAGADPLRLGRKGTARPRLIASRGTPSA